MSIVNLLKDGLWPGGHLKTENVVRTQEEKLRTRDEANRKLSALMPGMFQSGYA
jgi:sorting nexin-25